MSNGRRLRHRNANERCVFCEIIQAAHHIATVTAPHIADDGDRYYVAQLAASVIRDVEAMEKVVLKPGGLGHNGNPGR
jgi:hypothetical protein